MAVPVVEGSGQDAEDPEAGHQLGCQEQGVGLQAGCHGETQGGQGQHQVLKQDQNLCNAKMRNSYFMIDPKIIGRVKK